MKEKIKQFYFNHKDILFVSVLVTLIVFSNFFKPLWFATWPFLILFFATSTFSEQVSYIVFLAVFSGISEIYVSAMLACLLISGVKYAFDVKNKKQPLFKMQLFLTLAFIVVFSAIFGKVDVNGFFNWALAVGLLLFAYLLFVYGKQIDVKRSFNFLFIAVAISLILGVGVVSFDLLKRVVYPFDGQYCRLRLFTLNVNHLAMFSMFGIAFAIHQLFNGIIKNDFQFLKNKNFWFEFAKIVMFAIVGVLTMSKAFLLVLALVFVYVCVMLAIKLKWKSLYVILPLIVAISIVALIFKDFVSDIISRFFVYNQLSSTLSRIFTGRTDIWVEYLTKWSKSVWKVLLGAGLLTKDLISSGPHNVFIYVIYRVGLVGVVGLSTLAVLYAKQSKSKIKITISNCLLFAVWCVFALEEMILSDRFVLFLVFGLLLMLNPKENSSKTKLENEKIVTNTDNL